MKTSRLAVCAVVGMALALPADALAAHVWFVHDGSLTATERNVGGVRDALHAVLAGPNRTERASGLRSAIPPRVPLKDFRVDHRVVTLDFGERIAAGSDPRTLRTRLGQIVRTVGGVPGVVGVRLLVDGGVPLGLFPGYDLRRPLTPRAIKDEPGTSVRDVQELLSDLGFMAQGTATGVEDARTDVAVLGFEKWAGLPRDGRLSPVTIAALERSPRPTPAERLGSGRRVEVLLDRQLALLIVNDHVERAVHISTGSYGRTPIGSFHVYRKELYSWSVPFKVWMPWASYFTGGIAFHEYPVVPSYPASHGCVRVNAFDAPTLYSFATYGTPVRVISSWA